MMKKTLQHLTLFFLLLITGVFAVQANQNGVPQFAATGGYRVTTTTDSNDGTCDSHCSLREAIIAANNDTGINPIVYIPDGTYTLTIAGAVEDAAATGDLDITRFMTIIGEGRDTTIIDGNDLDRVFDVHGAFMEDNQNYYFPMPQFVLSDVTVQNGFVSGASGGGIRISSSSTIITEIALMDVVIQNSQADDGGGIALKNVDINTYRLRLLNNSASNRGGGLFHDGGDAINTTSSFYLSVINMNTAVYGGGAYLLTDVGTFSPHDSDMIGLMFSAVVNNAAQDGGGIYMVGQSYDTYFTGTLSGNQASNHGGGIYNQDFATTIYNATITNNTADANNDGNGDGGGIYGDTGYFGFSTSIVYGNTDSSGQAPECGGSLQTQTQNSIIGNFAPCSNTVGTGTVTGQDPLLLALADNGGDTLTHALQASSPAIDMSSGDVCSSRVLDQRGIPYSRYEDTCEPGAFAYVDGIAASQFPPVPVTGIMDLPGSTIDFIPPYNIKFDFMEAMRDVKNSTSDSAEVDNPNNYRVIAAGVDGVFQSQSCAALLGDDTLVPFSVSMNRLHFSVEPDPRDEDAIVMITAPDGMPFAHGIYRVIICDEITDIDGNAIDGDLDMLPGGDAVFTVRMGYFPHNVLHVTSPSPTTDGNCNSHCTLTEAVNAANSLSGKTWIYIPAGVYTHGSAHLSIQRDITIIGVGMGETVIDANSSRRIFHVTNNSVLTLDGLTLREAYTTSPGGAVYAPTGSVYAYRVHFDSNTASTGGAIYANSVRAFASEFSNNTATNGDGGAIYGVLSTYASSSAFIANSASGYGSAIRLGTYGSIDNSTLSSNLGDGGVVYYLSPSQFVIEQSTVANNESGIFNDGGSSEFYSYATIFANNGSASCGTHPDFAPSTGTYQARFSIFSDGGCVQASRNLYNTDALLLPLAHYTGQTRTHALAPNSPARNIFMPHLCTSTTDQRGVARHDDGFCNIGAFEGSIEPLAVPMNLQGSTTVTGNGIQIDVTWDDNNSDETNYLIERRLDGGTTWVARALLAANTTTYQDRQSCGGSPDYRVRAYRSTYGDYSDGSNTFTVPAIPCTPPIIIDYSDSIHANYNDIITLFITVESPYTNTTYRWYAGVSGNTFTPQLGSVSTLNTPAIHSSYWVRVTNPSGVFDSPTLYVTYPFAAPVINSVSANPNPIEYGHPLTLSADVTGDGTLTYEWSVWDEFDRSYTPIGTGNPLVVAAEIPEYDGDMTSTYRLRVTNEGGMVTSYTSAEIIPGVVNTCTVRQLTHNNINDLYPFINFISADGSRAVVAYEYQAYPFPEENRLEVLDTETGAVIMSVDDAVNFGWKAIDGDGSRVIFQGYGNYAGQNADGNRELFMWDEASGFSQLTFTLTANEIGVGMPFISDNGHVATFISNYGGVNTRLPNYYLNMWQQGVGLTRLVPFPLRSNGLQSLAALSGDGNAVAFIADANPVGQNADRNLEVFLWRRGLPLLQLTQTTGDHMTLSEVIVTINYNGTRVGFYSSANITGENPSQTTHFFIWDNATGIRQITETQTALFISMNAQGDRLVGFGTGDYQPGKNLDHGDEIFYWTENVGWTQVTSKLGFRYLPFGDISGDGQTIIYPETQGGGGVNEFFIAECPPVPTPPLAPSAPTAGDVTDTSITLNWQDNSIGETAFHIERSDDGTNWTEIGTTDGNIATFVDSDVACSTDYHYRVRAYNAALSVYSPYSPVTIISSGACPPLVDPVLTLDTVTANEAAMTITNVDALATAIHIEVSSTGHPSQWYEVEVLDSSTTTYSDTTLLCEQTRHYRVRVYRSNDETFSQPSNVVTAITPDCPALAQPPMPTVLLTDRTAVQLSVAADISGQVNNIYLQRSVNGVDWQTVTTFATAGGSTVNSNLVCETDYYYRVQTYRQHDNEYSLPSDPVMTTTTACPIPFESTVGLYRNGLWIFTDTNSTGMPDIQFRFGPQEAGWIPIVGDWDGDGIDGIGVYRNGVFVLRNTTSAGMQDSLVYFGMREAGWQPLVGDWNGDGRDTVGVYKAGQFMLTNDHATSSLDHRFTWNTAGLSWLAIAGDWDASGADSVGLYHAGTFLLSHALDNSTPQRFNFGPTQNGWTPVAGDWNTDGTDTIGIYSQSIWRLRNSNNAGNVDVGFNFGVRETGWYPVASYRGGVAPLLALSQAANITLDVSIEPTVAATIAPTEPPVVEITPEVTVEETTEITATSEVVITAEATAEVTVMPTETPVPLEPTLLPTETPLPEATAAQPEATQEASAP